MTLGCFCYLVNHSGGNSVSNCVKSLRLLYGNYLKEFPTPVFLFHESGLTENMKAVLIQSIPSKLTFIPIEFSVPTHVNEINQSCRIGYMHMCRFFANEIFYHPVLNDFEYYCRLDTDSYILSPVKSNIFEDVKTEGILYGFINDSIKDLPQFTEGLWPLADDFLKRHPEIPRYSRLYSDITERSLYYTNFEICKISWFKDNPWKLFFDEIDKNGGIYKHRWGDHTIRYIGVRSFVPSNQIKRITNIHYSHQGIENNKPKQI